MKRIVKKQVMILLAVLVLISSVVITSYADTVPTFTASDATGSAGEEVTVTIECSDVTAVTCWKIGVTYDQNVLEFVKSDLNGVFSGVTDGDPNNVPYVISWVDGLANKNVNGKIAEITFKIKDSAAAGDYPITLEYNEKEVVKLNDVDKTQFDQVHFDIKNGKVSVAEKVESKTESKVESKTESKVESKTESKVESKTESKVESKTESKAESKPDSKLESKTESKSTSSRDVSSVTSTKTTSTNSTVSSVTSSTTNNTVTSPKTGNTYPFVVTLLVFVGSIAVIAGFGKRKENN